MKRLLTLFCALPLVLSAQESKPKTPRPFPTTTQEATHTVVDLITDVSTCLADTFVLYTEALNFHWNVVGNQFFVLHDFFGKQYDALSDAIDLLAEQVRILGGTPPSTLQAFLQKAHLQEPKGKMSAQQMLEKYLADNESMSQRLSPIIAYSVEMGQDGVADLLTQQLRFHDKTAWMVRSSLSK